MGQGKMIAEASAGRSSNWKLYVVAITCVCFLAGMLVNSVSESAPADNQLDSVVTQALKMFHGSKANMPNADDSLAGEADFQKRFKTLKGKADLYLQNETLTAWKTMNKKNVVVAGAIEKAFPQKDLKAAIANAMKGSGSGSG